MIYIFAIGLILIILIILWVRKSRGSSYNGGSKVWQNELDQRMADDYGKQSGHSSPRDEFWDPYD